MNECFITILHNTLQVPKNMINCHNMSHLQGGQQVGRAKFKVFQ